MFDDVTIIAVFANDYIKDIGLGEFTYHIVYEFKGTLNEAYVTNDMISDKFVLWDIKTDWKKITYTKLNVTNSLNKNTLKRLQELLSDYSNFDL